MESNEKAIGNVELAEALFGNYEHTRKEEIVVDTKKTVWTKWEKFRFYFFGIIIMISIVFLAICIAKEYPSLLEKIKQLEYLIGAY